MITSMMDMVSVGLVLVWDSGVTSALCAAANGPVLEHV